MLDDTACALFADFFENKESGGLRQRPVVVPEPGKGNFRLSLTPSSLPSLPRERSPTPPSRTTIVTGGFCLYSYYAAWAYPVP